ncbi:MAG: hypothetical protein V4568_04925 [Pseudomonadota bacterium]
MKNLAVKFGLLALAVLLLSSCVDPIDINSPLNGATINDDHVLVTGTIQAPAHSGITANGIVGTIDGKQAEKKRFWVDVPLVPGENKIIVTGTTPQGESYSKTVTVNRQGTPPISVKASKLQGLAPLNVSFIVTGNTGNPIQHISADFNGDGIVDYDSSDPSAAIAFTYTTPGIYRAKFTVIDTQASYTQTLTIVARDLAEMETMFQEMWSGMNDALTRRDKAAAMRYLNQTAQAKYGPVFDALMPDMRKIVRTYSPLTRMDITDTIGEYVIHRNDAGKDRIYFIYFLLDGDGVWRIDSM